MTRLPLSVAMGDYDRTRALVDGRVLIDGVDPVFLQLSPEEMFFRSLRSRDFDVTELSLSSYVLLHSRGECPYVAVPAFLSRAFRHTSIWVRKDRIRRPEDLKGRRIGLPEYQLTANVWARALLEEDFGVRPSDITWVRGGIDTPGRPEKVKLELPADVHMEDAPAGTTISELLDRGEIDGFIAPRPPSLAPMNSAHPAASSSTVSPNSSATFPAITRNRVAARGPVAQEGAGPYTPSPTSISRFTAALTRSAFVRSVIGQPPNRGGPAGPA